MLVAELGRVPQLLQQLLVTLEPPGVVLGLLLAEEEDLGLLDLLPA